MFAVASKLCASHHMVLLSLCIPVHVAVSLHSCTDRHWVKSVHLNPQHSSSFIWGRLLGKILCNRCCCSVASVRHNNQSAFVLISHKCTNYLMLNPYFHAKLCAQSFVVYTKGIYDMLVRPHISMWCIDGDGDGGGTSPFLWAKGCDSVGWLKAGVSG